MFHKDKRRAERRWRSFHAWMRRLQDDWWTHGSRLNPRGVYLHMKETGVCVIKRGDNWRDRYYCDCFDFALAGSYHFKNTPHSRCSRYECKPEEYSHGQDSRPIQEWRELARAMGDEAPVDLVARRREPDKMVMIRKTCLCGYLMGKEWKRVQDVKWTDRRSDKRCPDCKRRLEERKRMPA